jgi:hypothetical protein
LPPVITQLVAKPRAPYVSNARHDFAGRPVVAALNVAMPPPISAPRNPPKKSTPLPRWRGMIWPSPPQPIASPTCAAAQLSAVAPPAAVTSENISTGRSFTGCFAQSIVVVSASSTLSWPMYGVDA